MRGGGAFRQMAEHMSRDFDDSRVPGIALKAYS